MSLNVSEERAPSTERGFCLGICNLGIRSSSFILGSFVCGKTFWGFCMIPFLVLEDEVAVQKSSTTQASWDELMGGGGGQLETETDCSQPAEPKPGLWSNSVTVSLLKIREASPRSVNLASIFFSPSSALLIIIPTTDSNSVSFLALWNASGSDTLPESLALVVLCSIMICCSSWSKALRAVSEFSKVASISARPPNPSATRTAQCGAPLPTRPSSESATRPDRRG
mmetsp:Transcript_7194/g.14104  ORF Transcript_7194/g.14104 Transcript_7194/m.14104 type:complete len:226 (-) Transcript_7194:382-1059(-)